VIGPPIDTRGKTLQGGNRLAQDWREDTVDSLPSPSFSVGRVAAAG